MGVFQKCGFLLVLAFVGLFTACTRPQDDSGKVSISIPQNMLSSKAGTLDVATLKLAHVSINISGSGIDGVRDLQWDAHSGGSELTPPAAFTIDGVTIDKERLVQVLAVYKDSTTQKMTFYYGDVTQMISASNPNVTVTMAVVGGAQDVVNGHVSGRVLDTADAGPTGLVAVKYSPTVGKPSLVVDRTYVVNGWFSTIMLSGAKFEYTFEDGKGLFPGSIPVGLDSELFLPATNPKILKVAIPVHTRLENKDGTPVPTVEDANIFVWGYWAREASVDLSGKNICDDLATGSFSAMKVYSDPPLASNANLAYLRISAGSALPTGAALLATTNPLSTISGKGGVQVSSSACGAFSVSSTTDAYANFLYVGKGMLDGQGNDSAAGFRYVFRSNTTTTEVLTSTVTAASTAVSGRLLPGVSAKVSGLKFFKRLVASSDEKRIETPVCQEIANSTSGYSLAGELKSFNADGSFSAQLNINSADLNSGSNVASLVTCAVMSDGSSLAPVGYYSTIRGSGTGTQTATKIALVYGSAKMANATCVPVTLEGRTATNVLGVVPNGVSVTLSSPDANTGFYQYSSCSGSITALDISGGLGSNAQLFVRRGTTGTQTTTLALTPNSGLSATSFPVTFADAPGSPTKSIRTNIPSTISAYDCIPLSYETWHEDGLNSMLISFGSSYSYSLPSATGLTFYYGGDSNCQFSPATGGSIGLSTLSVPYFVKYTGTATSLDLRPTSASFTGDAGTYVNGDLVTVIQPGNAAMVRMEMALPIPAEVCQPVTFHVVDSYGHTSPASSSTTYSFTFNGAGTPPANSGFYSDTSCSSSQSTVTISPTDTRVKVYFRWAQPGSVAVDGVMASGGSLPLSGISGTVSAAPVAKLVVLPPSVTFTPPANFSGNSFAINEGDFFPLTIEARSPLGNLVTSYTETNPATMNLNATYAGLSCNPLTWGSPGPGRATTTCTYIAPSDYFSSVLMGFSTFQGPMIPYSGTPGSIRIIRKAEASSVMKDYLMSKSFGHLTSGQCQPLLYTRGTNAGDYTGSRPVATFTSGTISSPSGVEGIYSDQGCTAPSPTVTLTSNDSAKLVYAKLNGSGISGLNVGGQLAYDLAGATTFTTASYSVGTGSSYAISMSRVQPYGACGPVMIVRADTHGTATPASGGETMTLMSTGFTSTWHTDAKCTSDNVSSNYAWSSGQTAVLLYMRPTSPGTGTVNATGTFVGSASSIQVDY